MKGQGYESVKSEEAASAAAEAVDPTTKSVALLVSLLSCAVSIAAIGFIVFSLRV